MTITAAATGTPIAKPNGYMQFVDGGVLTSHGLQLLADWREFLCGINRVIPCNASGTNLITLTPLDSGPVIEKYVDYEIFSFTAANTTSGAVTATVVPRTGTLATLKAYIDNGATQASVGDVVAGCVYLAVYAHHLDTSAGGFVLK